MTQEQDTAAPASLETGDSCCARRSVLRGALALGAVGIGGALAGCGSSKSSDTASSGAAPAGSSSTGGGASAAPSAAAASTPAASAEPSAASAPSGGASGGTSLGSASKVPVGGGMVYDSQKIVVTQPTAGQYKAFTAVCTHEQCTVGDVSDGVINCYCHGSKFSITDGSVKGGPAPSPLAAKMVSVSGGNITVSG